MQLSDGDVLLRPYDISDVDQQLTAARDSVAEVNP
jgi:hypothetical protein